MALLLVSVATCASLLCTPALPAQKTPPGPPRVHARLLLDCSALAPGESTWGLLELEPQRDWHVYWQQPGDSGEPPRLTWELPKGLSAGELQHPAPELYREGPLVQFIHPGAVGLPFRLSADADFVPPADGTPAWQLEASASWLVCKDVCEFELAEFSVEVGWLAPAEKGLPPGESGRNAKRSAPQNASIAAAVAKLPVPTPAQAWSAVHNPASQTWQFELGPLPAAAAAHLPAEARSWRAFDHAEFFPASSESIPFGAPVTDLAIRADSSNFTIAATPAVGPRTGSTRRLPSGVLVLRGPDGLELALALLPPAPTPPDTGSR